MSDILIRKALFSDIESVYEIEQESVRSWTIPQFLQELDNKFSLFLVAEKENIIAGYLIAWKIADEIQLNSIAVKKYFRRQGIGNKLLSEINQNDFNKCYSKIYLEVRSRNQDALDFYFSNGFTKTGVRKNYYRDDDAILMEKKI